MNNENHQDREREVGERIANSIQSIGQGAKQQITEEELQKLKTAADRLDQMLKAAVDSDRQALRNAAVRLDQLLADIRTGNDITNGLRRSVKVDPEANKG